MKVLITGGNGQLGYHLGQAFQEENISLLGHKELDVTNYDKVNQTIIELKPDVIIHAAAYTNVDACEQNEELAYLVNTIGTRNVVLASRKTNARLVYISTDFVFDGTKNSPYLPSDQPNPINVYGRTKLAGERTVASLHEKYYIIRTSWLFGDQGPNFVKTILKLAHERRELTIVNDQTGSPTYAKDLSGIIWRLIQTDCFGIYQVSNKGEVSWFEFARAILHQYGILVPVRPITSVELGRLAKRPTYSVMSALDIEKTLNIQMRTFQDTLKEFHKNSN